jgi:hypothetical protein
MGQTEEFGDKISYKSNEKESKMQNRTYWKKSLAKFQSIRSLP